MGKIISFANQKGGVGKTTIATNVAVMFERDDKKVLLVDADPQSSSMDFRSVRAENEEVPQFAATQILTPTLHNDLKRFDFDFILVDVGGRDNKIFRSSILGSDIVIVPICPSQYDFWSSQQTFEFLQEAKLTKPDLKVYAMLNMVIPNTKIANEINDLITEYEREYEVKFFKSYLCSRVTYKYSVSKGLGVSEISGSSKDNKAIDEMTGFYNEIKEAVNV